MRSIISLLKFFPASLLLLTFTFGQGFDVNDYINFLQSHQNMTTEELLSMHPAGTFLGDIGMNYEDALYFDSIDSKYNLTEFEKSLISQHGFMVSERLSKISFGQGILEIFHSDLPVFVSTDAILHAYHVSYDRILKDIEAGLIKDKLITLLNSLHSNFNLINNKYGSDTQMITMLKDVDLYVTVPLLLLEENVSPFFPENQGKIDAIMNFIDAEQPATLNLFANHCRLVDWSQFKPRGHYVFHPAFDPVNLEGYFKAMMWLGRIEVYLLAPQADTTGCSPSFEDIKRQTIDAVLIDELFDLSSANNLYDEIEGILKFFIGESDNVTLPNMDYLMNAVQIDSANQLLNNSTLLEFQDTLKNQSFAYQLILSHILFSDPFSPDSIVPASAFLLFGQRFVIDSYVTAQVVFDRIMYQGQKICRLKPSSLDVLFSLGNDASAQLLIDELNSYHYSTNLAALRYLIDHYDPAFWSSSMYNYWLSLVRSLNPPDDRSNLPQFMQTAAYWQEKINTQLSSWTELRHDNLLYAKQSYTGGTICSYPYSFVEPFPEFYSNLQSYADYAYNYFSGLNIDPSIKGYITSYFSYLNGVADTLNSITTKELSGEPFTPEEISFLHLMLYDNPEGSGDEFDGWYPKLFYRDPEYSDENFMPFKGLMGSDNIVADIHTVPTDCDANPLGWVIHVGTGDINLAVVITENNNNELTAFVGPVMSYYEYTTTNFLRLNDDEWASTYLQQALRPDWVNLYLADSMGNSRGDGSTLITNVEMNDNSTIPQSEILVRNYPNPFNPSTIIAFTIPRDLTNSFTTLQVYNVQGKLIRNLLSGTLSSGNYLTKWDGKNDLGEYVSSGVYIYNLRVAQKSVSGKMMLLK